MAKYWKRNARSGLIQGLGACARGSVMLSPIERAPTSQAPRLAASMMPGPPPVTTTKSFRSSCWKRREMICAKRRSEERRVGKELSVRVDLGGRRIIKKKKKHTNKYKHSYRTN